MPSEQHISQPPSDQPLPESVPAQVKHCSACHCAVSAPLSILFPDVPLCSRCGERARALLPYSPPDTRPLQGAWQVRFPELKRSAGHHEVHEAYLNDVDAQRGIHGNAYDTLDSGPSSPSSDRLPTPTAIHYPTASTLVSPVSDLASQSLPPRHSQPSAITYRADPLADVTRLRLRSQVHRCLYPGARFQGTQKSGRNSYDVSVTVVDVDFSSAFLCGYLSIRGLTEDWPELTTYFDAEIIGSRHGFLTGRWGATETDDYKHWDCFPAFHQVRKELQRPSLTMPDRERGAVFMRWKERFLVPDHRVHDINGASFAGFYYVCVDFNPTGSVRTQPDTVEEEPSIHETAAVAPPMSPSISTSSTHDVPMSSIVPARRRRDSSRRGRDASAARRGVRSPSAGPRPPPAAATMNGFYFHQTSEPFQQLSLTHVQTPGVASFEFR